jgi:hypothetical protein
LKDAGRNACRTTEGRTASSDIARTHGILGRYGESWLEVGHFFVSYDIFWLYNKEQLKIE